MKMKNIVGLAILCSLLPSATQAKTWYGDVNVTGEITTSPRVYGADWDNDETVPTRGDVYDALEDVKTNIPTSNSQLTNDAGYITSYSETDPLFSSWDKDYADIINTPDLSVYILSANNLSDIADSGAARINIEAASQAEVSPNTLHRGMTSGNPHNVTTLDLGTALLIGDNSFSGNNTFSGNDIFSGTKDFSLVNHFILSGGADLPGTCSDQEIWILTSAPTGQRIYVCEGGAGNWVLQGGTGSGSITSVNGYTTAIIVLDASDIAETVDHRYMTDIQQSVLINTSGSNTGDNIVAVDGDITTGTDVIPKLFTAKQIHDEATGSVGIDWTLASQGTIDPTNYEDVDTQLNLGDIETMGFVLGEHTVDTHADNAEVSAMPVIQANTAKQDNTLATGVDAITLSGQVIGTHTVIEAIADAAPAAGQIFGYDASGVFELKDSIAVDFIFANELPTIAGQVTYDAANDALRSFDGANVDNYSPDNEIASKDIIDASGFNSNLDTGDTQIQELAQKFNDYVGGGASLYVATPPTYNDEACTAGSYAFDTEYIYDCVASGDWNRIATDDWSNPQSATYALTLGVAGDGTITINSTDYTSAGSPYTISGLSGATTMTTAYSGASDTFAFSGTDVADVTGGWDTWAIDMNAPKEITGTFSVSGGGSTTYMQSETSNNTYTLDTTHLIGQSYYISTGEGGSLNGIVLNVGDVGSGAVVECRVGQTAGQLDMSAGYSSGSFTVTSTGNNTVAISPSVTVVEGNVYNYICQASSGDSGFSYDNTNPYDGGNKYATTATDWNLDGHGDGSDDFYFGYTVE